MKDERLDREIEQRFGALHADATAGKLYQWREEASGRLAEIIILDQFSRNLEFELKHKMTIDRFGRYPHRNTVLDRESTPEELQYLKQPSSSF